MLPLRLQYVKREDGIFEFWIAQQDEALRHNLSKDLKNGSVLSIASPDYMMSSQSRATLWIRGSNKDIDDRRMAIDLEHLRIIAKLIAEFNRRKNVVEISDSGYIQ